MIGKDLRQFLLDGVAHLHVDHMPGVGEWVGAVGQDVTVLRGVVPERPAGAQDAEDTAVAHATLLRLGEPVR